MKSAIRGKRGQAFLKELVEALDLMPEKRLIREELRSHGEVCTLGAIGVYRGIAVDAIDPEDHAILACEFGVASQLIQEIEFENDDAVRDKTPEDRWKRMRAWAVAQITPEKCATS